MEAKAPLGMLRTFWKSEIVAEQLYHFMAGRHPDANKKETIIKIKKMERSHAAIWSDISLRTHGVSFQVSVLLKLEILLMKLIYFVIPFTIFVHYMEHNERNAILEYAELLELYATDERTRKQIINVIRQEIGHEWYMMEQVANKSTYVSKAKEAIHGMTAGIIETLALVIGLLAVHASSRIIGLTGLISTIAGAVAIVTISYLSAKGHHDLYEGRVRELSIKKDVHPMTLRQELEGLFAEKGIDADTVKDLMNVIGDDVHALSNLIQSLKIAEEAIVPREAVQTTITFFVIGALPILIPFFAGIMWNAQPFVPAVIAFTLAIVIVSIAGLFIAVLSGKKISTKVIHNILIIVGACSTTYVIGLMARLFLGIEAGH